MTRAAELAVTILAMVQGTLAFEDFCPPSPSIDTVSSTIYHYAIAGGGTAGSIVAMRLSECPDVSVILLEEGGCPPMISHMPGNITGIPGTEIDRQFDIYYNADDGIGKYNKRKGVYTAGKMLGGSGGLDHMIDTWGELEDYKAWCEATGDPSWCGEAFRHYFRKSENMTDAKVLEQNTTQHGRNGPVKLTRETSSTNECMLNAYKDMGFSVLDDVVGQCGVHPSFTIADGVRQNGVVGYLSKVKNRKNLHILTGARVEKVIFNGTTAIGFKYTYNGTLYNVTATNKVIVSTGVMVTPQLLTLSGVGNKATLDKLGITPVVENSNVGMNLRDQVAVVMAFGLDNSTTSTPFNPHMFPGSVTDLYLALNSSQSYPDMLSINVVVEHDSEGLMELCSNCFKYTDEICNKICDYNIGRRTAFVVTNMLHPSSTGCVTPITTSIEEQPIINLGLLSNRTDLSKLASLLMKFGSILNTTTFQNIGAEFADLGICDDYNTFSYEFWKCYILSLAMTSWHVIGTCSMGKVVDGNLEVMGTQKLMLIDASVLPSFPSGKVAAAIRATAEKGSDIIKTRDGLCCNS